MINSMKKSCLPSPTSTPLTQGRKGIRLWNLLSAWLPDVEKFSKEIGKQQAYIDSLKERIGQESDYAGRMRDEKYEQELKVQKANQRIFELQRTNEQMGRLLSKKYRQKY